MKDTLFGMRICRVKLRDLGDWPRRCAIIERFALLEDAGAGRTPVFFRVA